MSQVASSPAQRTALSKIVPCADPSVTANLGAFTRYMGYTTVVLVNRTIAKSAPQVFTKVLKAPRGLCNPFGPAPMYKFDNATCFRPQKPCKKHTNGTKAKCPPRVIDYPTLITVWAVPCSPSPPTSSFDPAAAMLSRSVVHYSVVYTPLFLPLPVSPSELQRQHLGSKHTSTAL